MLEQNPLASFVYCPRCGQKGFRNEGERAKSCPHCELTYYHNVAAAVACFVVDDAGQLLVARRGREPAKGTLDLPGGFVDPLETVEEAVQRELKEETGLTAYGVHYLHSLYNIYPYSGIDVYTSDLLFLVRVHSFEGAVASDDAAELLILRPEQLCPQDFGLHSVRRAIEQLMAHPELLTTA